MALLDVGWAIAPTIGVDRCGTCAHPCASCHVEARPKPGVDTPAQAQGAATFRRALDMRDGHPAEESRPELAS